MNHSSKRARIDVIDSAWLLNDADHDLERERLTLLDILEQARSEDHHYDEKLNKTCAGEWVPAAIEVLQKNNISVEWFANLIKNALQKGRGKKNKILIHGGTNRAKSFMFLPIFKTFSCPSDTIFNWVDAPEMEVIFLNDLRYSDKIMPWNVFLNFLEGAEIQVSMPKNHFAKDVTWSRKQPIFATADKPHSPRTP